MVRLMTTRSARLGAGIGQALRDLSSKEMNSFKSSLLELSDKLGGATVSLAEGAKAAGDGFSMAVSDTVGKLNEGAARLELAMTKAEEAATVLGNNTRETANVISTGTAGIRSALEFANLVAGNYIDVSGKLQQVADDMVAASREVASATGDIKTAAASQNEANTLLREVLPTVGRSIEQGSSAMGEAVRSAGQSLSDIEKTLDKTTKGLEQPYPTSMMV